MYKLFLDDVRDVPMVYHDLTNNDFVVVRSYEAFITFIKQNGLPAFISFDNDLGEDENGTVLPDGYAAAKWLVYESGLDLKELNFKMHSANPVASVQIQSLLDNYISFLKKG
ncbi:cyclic-phosphate processing receiver domain-containing protein [Flavobacterium alkalisoli]|uniref:cyclic-phosphate processing receiver domain-containing protein n=1 Tax=Flavobacterium alkalisoli TaxID=2602769 RepID=UPI003A939DE6